ncbi:hypothetical protein LX87_04702 [Larkinella arboricola]|uniref:Uncharacterized protein n=1 Tax=Larkinella arboricola TaxID=643671 RepID=A0A327WVR7_LARAB|nr:hypothetical protein [Larkinella arboricola]RAJ93190.1 hypothetical protein LX87_04702 [Larkinella arboricola]
MKKYKVITLTKLALAGEENIIHWAANDSSLYADLQNGWSIEQISTSSPTEGQLSLTLVLSSVSKEFDIEDV